MYKVLALLLSFEMALVSCASVVIPPSPKAPIIDDSKLVDQPIEDREAKTLPKGSFGRKVLLKDNVAPGDGVLLDEKEVARLALIKAERDRLRADLLTERKLKANIDYIYQKALWESEVKFLKSQPSWWERHDGKIALFAGLLIGAVMSVGVAYGINRVK